MNLYSKATKEVDALPSGSQIGAFFNFDNTIIYGNSATTYLREQVKRGDISPKELVELTQVMTQFGLGNMDFSSLITVSSQYLRGIAEADYLEFSEQLYNKHLAKLVYPESRALIEAHLRKGHTVAIVSAATPYQIMPAAKELGVEHVRCSKLEVVDGVFTGSIVRSAYNGKGKVDAVEQLADQFDIDVNQSFFYTDSDQDLELLRHVGKPRPLNPSKMLRRIAQSRGWPVQDFNSRGRITLFDYAKTVATQASMLTSFIAGLPIYALTGSISKTRNFSISLFADTACAISGIELDVSGEENVWANRPCVFLFNHQSKADVIIMTSLLRRDLAGVGKKEIADVPILGTLMKIGGTVLIDRENSQSARDSMEPLIGVLQNEGRSVCIAPEGTRSTSTALGPFKKGAFHLAMQAGVPIVPIVIHNAFDVAPKGQFAFRPATVKITVLPAIDVGEWTAETLNQHVADVRDQFLEELGQKPSQFDFAEPNKKTNKVVSAKTVNVAVKEAKSVKTKKPAAKVLKVSAKAFKKDA